MFLLCHYGSLLAYALVNSNTEQPEFSIQTPVWSLGKPLHAKHPLGWPDLKARDILHNKDLHMLNLEFASDTS